MLTFCCSSEIAKKTKLRFVLFVYAPYLEIPVLLSVPVTAKRINVKAELGLCLSLIQISYYAVNLAAVKLGCKYSS